MQTAKNVSKGNQTTFLFDASSNLSAPPIQPLETTGNIMEDAKTPDEKEAAFRTLVYTGTDATITQAVDHFYDNPSLFSQTVQDLAGEVTHKDQLKLFLQKMADPNNRIGPFIEMCFLDCLEANSLEEYHESLKPYLSLEKTFKGADKNRRATKSCPSAYDLLRTFNTVNQRLLEDYVPFMFKRIAHIHVMQGPQ